VPPDIHPPTSSSIENTGDDAPLDTDVVMGNEGSFSGILKDENLPVWLTHTIVYLRRVSDATSWHDLVSGLIEFENCAPPHGVSFISISMETD
jgi:hypothetical protein